MLDQDDGIVPVTRLNVRQYDTVAHLQLATDGKQSRHDLSAGWMQGPKSSWLAAYHSTLQEWCPASRLRLSDLLSPCC